MAEMKRSKEIKQLAQEMSSPESKVILDEYTSLVESPEFRKSAPPETQTQLNDAISRARQAYESQATKNEWLEIAQTLAGAVAQYGAARQAGSDYTSRLGAVPNTDWAGRTARARADYLEAARQAEREQDTARRDWQLSEEEKKTQFDRSKESLEARLRDAQKREEQSRQEGLESLRDRKLQQREDSDLWRAQLKSTEQEVSDVQNRDKALKTTVSQLMRDDLSSKQKKKLAEKLGPEAARAGLDITEVLGEIEAVETAEPGVFDRMFSGKEKTPTEQKARTVYESLRQKAGIDRLDELVARRNRLLQEKRPITEEPGQVEASTVKSTPKTVRIQAPDGTIAEVPADKVQKYIDKGGKVVQ